MTEPQQNIYQHLLIIQELLRDSKGQDLKKQVFD
jgi:hypothetical protein